MSGVPKLMGPKEGVEGMTSLGPAVVFAVFWIAALIRKPSLFLGSVIGIYRLG